MNRFGNPKAMTDGELAAAIHRAELFTDPAVYAEREELIAEKALREEQRSRTILRVSVATLIVSAIGCAAALLSLIV